MERGHDAEQRRPGRPKLTLEAMQAAAREKGGECLSAAYEGAHRKLRWRCGEGHEWEATAASVRQRSWCPVCAPRGRPPLTLEDAQAAARERGGECLAAECAGSQAKLRWRCGEGHEWAATLSSVRNLGTWCPRCAPRGRPPLTLEDAQAAAQEKGGACLSEAYESSRDKLRWRCGRGHEWAASLNSVRNLGTWCPHCRASAAERRCRAILTRLLGPPSVQRRPAFTRTPDTPVGLELDIYYPQYGFAVEVQGDQHGRWVRHFQPTEADFEALRRRDQRKRELCFDNWVVLIEVGPDVSEARLTAALRDLAVPVGA